MRKVDEDFCAAVNRCCAGSFGGNTVVDVKEYSTGKWWAEVRVRLHGHVVCYMKKHDGALVDWGVDTCGFDTNVTLARMNAFVRLCVEESSLMFRRRGGATHWFWRGRDMGECSSLGRAEFMKRTETEVA